MYPASWSRVHPAYNTICPTRYLMRTSKIAQYCSSTATCRVLKRWRQDKGQGTGVTRAGRSNILEHFHCTKYVHWPSRWRKPGKFTRSGWCTSASYRRCRCTLTISPFLPFSCWPLSTRGPSTQPLRACYLYHTLDFAARRMTKTPTIFRYHQVQIDPETLNTR